jgi:hypothetical protein
LLLCVNLLHAAGAFAGSPPGPEALSFWASKLDSTQHTINFVKAQAYLDPAAARLADGCWQ